MANCGEYTEALQRFLQAVESTSLESAYTLGRQLLESGSSMLELVEAHAHIVGGQEPAWHFLLECLAPFEMAQSGYREALSVANQQLRHIFHTLDVMFFSVKHPENVFLQASPGCEKIYGRPASEFLANPNLWREVVVPEDVAVVDGVWAPLRAGRSITLQYRIRRADGERRTVTAYVQPTLDATGTLVRVDGIASDVTARARQEQRRAARMGIAQVLDGTLSLAEAGPKVIQTLCEALDWRMGVLWMVDARGGALRCEGTWHEPLLDVHEFSLALWDRTWSRGQELPGQVWASGEAAWKQGPDPFPLRVAFPVVQSGSVVGVVELMGHEGRPDVEQIGMLAATGAQLGQFLERRQAQDRLKKTEERLIQAQKSEAIGRLAGGVAHDFNNLLTVINGYAQFLLDEGEDREEIREILEAGQRAARLTGQLLAFSRKQVVTPEPVDVNQVVTGIESMLRRLIGEDVDLIVHLCPHPAVVKMDVSHVEQVLLNLAVNSRDAMPTGGKLTLETHLVCLDEAYVENVADVVVGDYVLLAVSDTGQGMAPETLAHIFEPFFTTKALGQGTGLGLATVHGIVKQSGGHVGVYSEVGRGTTFKVYLPVWLEDSAAPRVSPGRVVAAGGAETVLVVEDDGAIARLVHYLLEKAGYRILAASNGVEALEQARGTGEPIHLLLTDLIMPEMGGRQLADKLAEVHPETRVLYMSGYADDAVLHHGWLEPGMAFVPKPFAPDVLLHKVREVLSPS